MEHIFNYLSKRFIKISDEGFGIFQLSLTRTQLTLKKKQLLYFWQVLHKFE